MQTATHTPTGLKSTQIVAGVAVVLALLGGAYAVGRSQSPEAAPEPAEPAAQAAPAQVTDSRDSPDSREAAPAKAAVVAAPVTAAQPLSPADAERRRLAQLCDSCALITEVHAETRRGQGSGLGAVGGAVVGGLLGNMVGGGNGRKLATVGGAVAGGYAGNEIEKSQKTHTVWVVQAKDRDGRLHRFERSADPGVQAGDQVALHEGGFSLR